MNFNISFGFGWIVVFLMCLFFVDGRSGKDLHDAVIESMAAHAEGK